MPGNLEQGAASGPEPEHDAEAESAGTAYSRLDERGQALWSSARWALGAGAEKALTRPHLLWGGVAGLCALGGIALLSSKTLTASLQAALPEKIIGIERTDAASDSAPLRIQLGPRSHTASLDERLALNEVTSSNAPHVETISGRNDSSYLPKHGESPTASTIITIPAGQGRLLRFDEAVESVFIADPEIADIRVVSSDLVYVYGKKLGLTNLMAVSGRAGNQENNSPAQHQMTASALLRVVMDTRPSNESRQEWSPRAPVDITVFGRRTAIQGHMRNIDQAVDAANIAETYSPRDQPPLNKTTLAGSNQINIRVRFAEASRTDLKAFGIDWDLVAGGGSFQFGLEKSGSTQDPNLGIGVSAGNFNINLLIEALQANGALTILAEPNLTAVTGETASFLAGGEVPIPVPSGNNGDSITVQYKPFGVSLAFTPTMVKDGRIALRVKPEVSSIAQTTNFAVQGFNLPSFTVRRAETTVEMASGQTFAMAGLFQRDISRNVEKMPLLGDVPVLGELFRSERYQRNETELVILITPYLVEPVSDRSLATPLDRAGPSPWQADIIGPDPTAKGATLTESGGQSGFILK